MVSIRRCILMLILITGPGWSPGTPTLATTLQVLSVPELTRVSERVLEARVQEVRNQALNGEPFTLVEVTALEILKGQTQETLIVAVPGGLLTSGSHPLQVQVPGAPRLIPGERVLLFLEFFPHQTDLFHIVGLSQGVFHLSEAEGTAIQDLRGSRLVDRRADGSRQRDGGRTQVSLDALRREVRRALADQEVTR